MLRRTVRSIFAYSKLLVIIFSFQMAVNPLMAQNQGLLKPQDPGTLPQSRVGLPKSSPRDKQMLRTVLTKSGENEFIIQGGWELSSAHHPESAGSRNAAVNFNASGKEISSSSYNSSSWYNATVPGTVLTTLVDQGVYPDPYFGLNNLSIPDTLCRQKWWYRTVFKIPAATRSKKCRILFNGINYAAEIWLNGSRIGGMKGAFKRGSFDISDIVKKTGENVLAVLIIPPPHPGIPHEESPSAGTGPNGGQLCLDGPTFISSEGWDWIPGIRDRNIGLWQDVRLQFTGPVILGDPQVITDLPLPDTSFADITIKVPVSNNGSSNENATVSATFGNIIVTRKVSIKGDETKNVVFSPSEYPQLRVEHPKLWWPNGYGKQPLYDLRLAVNVSSSVRGKGDNLSDVKKVRFGIRELSYELSVDAPEEKGCRIEFDPTDVSVKNQGPLFDNVNRRKVEGETFVPSLRNGVKLSLFKRLDDKSVAPYLVIRVNGRRIFCRGGNWGMDDGMKRVSRERLEPYFKLHKEANFNMIRNWTGESTEEVFYDLCDEYGMLVWNDFWLSTEGYNLNPLDNTLFLSNAEDVILRFRNHPCIALWCPRNEGYAPAGLEDELAMLVSRKDGTRHYQPNSRYMNLRTSGPWHYQEDPKIYFSKIAEGFSTELGTPSVPPAAAIKKMMAKEDVWPVGDVWYYHDLHDGQKAYIKTIGSLYGPSGNVDDFCGKAQLVNYDSHRAMFESWNSKLWNKASGLLLWMSHPAWPSTVWQVYSSDFETGGAYFASKKACEPVHIQMNADNNRIVAVNTTLKTISSAKAELYLYDLSGKLLYRVDTVADLNANQLTPLFIPALPEKLPPIYLCRLQLTNNAGTILSLNDYWKTVGDDGFKAFNELEGSHLKGSVKRITKNSVEFELYNDSAVPCIAVRANLLDANGNAVLPVYTSDGYINLLPGERRSLSCRYDFRADSRFTLSASAYNLKELRLADF